MAFESAWPGRPSGARPHIGETATDYRARLAHEQEEMQQRRLADLAEQVSVRSTPSERILVWERLHEVPLPRNPAHKLLSVIAAATDLQLEQVQDVQRLRLLAARGVSAEPAAALPESHETPGGSGPPGVAVYSVGLSANDPAGSQ